MGDFGLFIVFMVPPLVLGLVIQWWLKRTFARYSGIQIERARRCAGRSADSRPERADRGSGRGRARGGPLSDHYDPRKKALFLSEPVYNPPSVAAAAVAAHETGHALQDSKGYVPKIRSAMYPAVAFASTAWIWLPIIGAVLNALNLVALALLLYAVAVAFHLVTLPVEFNASRRASTQLRELGIVGAGEQEGVNKVLRAAALTYVAGALAALSLLLYYALIFFGNRD